MRPDWGELGARARGLGTRLLGEAALRELARAEDLPALAVRLERTGWWLPGSDRPATPDPGRAAREREAALLELLLRRARDARPRLRALWAEDELRTLRVLVRGASAGVPAGQRLAAVDPVPGLDEGVLEEAARADGPPGVAAALEAAGHPAAADLSSALEGPAGADLFRLEWALARGTLGRAVRAARRDDAELRAFAADAVDLANAWSALLAPGWRDEAAPEELFLDGGRLLGDDAFREAAAATDADLRRRRLADALSGGPLGRPFADVAIPVGGLEPAVLLARCRAAEGRARARPLTAAPVVAFRLRLRLEVSALRRIARGLSLGAPPGRRLPVAGRAA